MAAGAIPIDSRDGLLHIPRSIKNGIWTTRCGFNVDERQRKAWHRLPIAGGRSDCTCKTCSDSLEFLAASPSFLYDTVGSTPVQELGNTLEGFRGRMLEPGAKGPNGYFSQWFVIECSNSAEAGSHSTVYRSSVADINMEYDKRARRIRLVNTGAMRGRKLEEVGKRTNDALAALRLNCHVMYPSYVLLAEDLKRWDDLCRNVSFLSKNLDPSA